jgi:triosephosphate isomerase
MKKLIVANWKMHFNPHEAELLIHKLNKAEIASNIEVVLCPPFIDLQAVARSIDAKKYKLGAQNAHQVDEGTFTGEVSAAMLRGLVDYVIIGHSERRQNFHETDAIVADKLAAVIRSGLKPILCVGENLDERHNDLSVRRVLDQLHANLRNLSAEDMKGIVIAYEPIWALSDGHGNSTHAKPEDVDFVFAAIRRSIEEMYGEDISAGLRLLYGGSADPEHCSMYLSIDGVNGLLVGGASLIAPKFLDILEASAK